MNPGGVCGQAEFGGAWRIEQALAPNGGETEMPNMGGGKGGESWMMWVMRGEKCTTLEQFIWNRIQPPPLAPNWGSSERGCCEVGVRGRSRSRRYEVGMR